MTIQQFYRPGGDSTQNRGVVSDVELPSLTTQLDVGESDLDYALTFDQVQPLQHDDYPHGRLAADARPEELGRKQRVDEVRFLRSRRAADQSLRRAERTARP